MNENMGLYSLLSTFIIFNLKRQICQKYTKHKFQKRSISKNMLLRDKKDKFSFQTFSSVNYSCFEIYICGGFYDLK